jgi:hypothetical protein
MMTVAELLKNNTDTDGNFLWGIDTVMKSIRPNCMFELTLGDGKWKITRWDKNWSDKEQRYIDPPEPEELMQEYERQKIIAEVVEYFNSQK